MVAPKMRKCEHIQILGTHCIHILIFTVHIVTKQLSPVFDVCMQQSRVFLQQGPYCQGILVKLEAFLTSLNDVKLLDTLNVAILIFKNNFLA